MEKNTKTKKFKYNQLVVERLMQKYSFSKIYVHQCLKGQRKSETADLLKKDYKTLCDDVKSALNK